MYIYKKDKQKLWFTLFTGRPDTRGDKGVEGSLSSQTHEDAGDVSWMGKGY